MFGKFADALVMEIRLRADEINFNDLIETLLFSKLEDTNDDW